MRVWIWIWVLMIGGVAMGAEEGHGGASQEPAAHHAQKQPTLPAGTTWAGVMLLIVAGMFIAAMVIGPIVRAEMAQEVPQTHSHDEPPGASDHGTSGTVNPDAH